VAAAGGENCHGSTQIAAPTAAATDTAAAPTAAADPGFKHHRSCQHARCPSLPLCHHAQHSPQLWHPPTNAEQGAAPGQIPSRPPSPPRAVRNIFMPGGTSLPQHAHCPGLDQRGLRDVQHTRPCEPQPRAHAPSACTLSQPHPTYTRVLQSHSKIRHVVTRLWSRRTAWSPLRHRHRNAPF
jgi:hypothetical protein